MCLLNKEKITEIKSSTPPPAPPPAPAASAAVAQGDVARPDEIAERDDLRIKKKGRAGLRIKLDAGNTSGGTGVNVPRA